MDNMDFGEAIRALKAGKKVARQGWNGKGMWLELYKRSLNVPYTTIDGHVIPMSPWIGMKTADNKFVPWLASQTDMLAEDYYIV